MKSIHWAARLRRPLTPALSHKGRGSQNASDPRRPPDPSREPLGLSRALRVGERLEQRADRRPELLLDLHGDRVGKLVGACGALAFGSEDADGELAIGVVAVAAAVAAHDGRANTRDLEQ